MMADEFSALLHELRCARGISAHQLAKQAGVDRSYVNRIEAGERLPSRHIAGILTQALNLTRADADRLMFAADLAPISLIQLGWDETLQAVADVLIDPFLPPQDLADFRDVIVTMARNWRRS